MPLLIAEISNAHFGNFDTAKALIRAAHNSGASIVKGQAFMAKDIKTGSMPFEFYEQCQFSFQEYVELIEYAREIGTDLFYSIFSPELSELLYEQRWHKIAGGQVRLGTYEKIDNKKVIVSVPRDCELPYFVKSEILHVSDYFDEEPELKRITELGKIYGRRVGYSDHTLGIETAISAARDYGAHIIEKHFCLEKSVTFKGVVYRDTVHGVTPFEFEALARKIK